MSYSSNILERRLSRLKTQGGHYFILALDHRLAKGNVHGLEDISLWLEFANKNLIPSVVLHRGHVQQIQPDHKYALVIQLMGQPRPTGESDSSDRTIVSSLSDAVIYGADVVSTQIGLCNKDLGQAISKISHVISEAHKMNFPVLTMVNIVDPKEYTLENTVSFIRYLNEIGTNLIKVMLPNCSFTESECSLFRKVVGTSPPIILAGGEKSDDLEHGLALAKGLDFSGICIGRNIFQSDDPDAVLATIKKYFW